jgi:hypothetical protein
MEVNILFSLGYELQRVNSSPTKFMLMFLKTLKAEKEIVQLSVNYLNDSYLGTAPLHYPPELLATACIYLAYKSTQVPMPRVAWWVLSEFSFELVDEAARLVYGSTSLFATDDDKCNRIVDKVRQIAAGKGLYKAEEGKSETPASIDRKMYKLTDNQVTNGDRHWRDSHDERNNSRKETKKRDR